MSPISLSKNPKHKELEEFVSAFFQAHGYYTERNIIEREIEEILELDILITDYHLELPDIRLIEVKSGGWHFRDIFKVRGWMEYLNIHNSLYVTNISRGDERDELCKQKSKEINVDLIVIKNLDQTANYLYEYIKKTQIDDVDIRTWRYSYWIERNMIELLIHKKKSNQKVKRYNILADYYHTVNSSIFFERNLLDRINKLYTTFQNNPRVSAKCGNEMIGNSFDGDHRKVPEVLFEKTYFNCEYNDIQISSFIEHRARLAILKNAIDFKVFKDSGINDERTELIRKILGFDLNRITLLPGSFLKGLENVSKDKYYYLYPVFWQWFLWVFGGFILKDYSKEEYRLLSEKTKIPIEEIDNAFDSYNKLFPQEDGWFIDYKESNIKVFKLFPIPYMGLGANYRRWLYTENSKYEELKLSGKFTCDDLIKWNNCTMETLGN